MRAILLSSCAPHTFLLALAYLVLRARRGSSLMLCHTSSFILDIPLPSAFSICLFHRRQRTSNVASSLSLHLPLPSASSTDIKEVPTSLHHCRFIAVASSLSLLHCHNVTTSGRYLGKCNAASVPYYLLITQLRRAEN